MLSNNPFLKLTALTLSVVILPQCTKLGDSHLQVNQQLASPYTMPATAYLAMAHNQTGQEQQALEIMAAGRSIYDGQWQQGLRILSQQKKLTPDLTNDKNMLLAKVDLIRERPTAAIRKLSSVHDLDNMGLYNQVQYHEMLASAYRASNNATDAVSERIKLEKLLPDNASRSNNRRALWLTVTTLPPAEISTLALEAPDQSELKGWMQLGLISRKQHNKPQTMIAEIEQWKTQFPSHPGNYILPAPLTRAEPHLFSQPQQIAVLLPLTGKLSGPGEAVRDGFMTAFKEDQTRTNTKIKFYDTGTNNAQSLYQQAIHDGANYVVGPLGKSSVAAVASENHPVPTLLLNDTNVGTKQNLYQFGISPSNEARQVASKARKNGNTHALIISPADTWGDEVVNAFTNQWHANGGQVIDTMRYSSSEDVSNAVRDVLHVSESEARTHELKSILGKKLQATPRRRQDFDMIFLLAYPSKARQIMPMLRYYYAGDVPVYAISSVYAGNTNTLKDRDLDGITFCDMPWVFDHQVGHKSWPEQWNSYNRLFALGMDSYELSSQLNQLLLFPAMGVSDHSGVLYLKTNQQIGRILAWGKFKEGQAELISDA